MISYEINKKFMERLESGDLADKKDSLLHFGERFEIARGDGWAAYLVAEGEIRGVYVDEHGQEFYNYDIFDEALTTDERIRYANAANQLTLDNNNWIEVQFFAEERDGYNRAYLDITADGDVAFDLDEGVKLFEDYINDTPTTDLLTTLVERWRKHNEKN